MSVCCKFLIFATAVLSLSWASFCFPPWGFSATQLLLAEFTNILESNFPVLSNIDLNFVSSSFCCLCMCYRNKRTSEYMQLYSYRISEFFFKLLWNLVILTSIGDFLYKPIFLPCIESFMDEVMRIICRHPVICALRKN